MEETVKSQRCQLLALQSHLQCALEAGQAALPALRTEMNSIRKLTVEWKQMASEELTRIQSDLMQQIVSVAALTEDASGKRLDEVLSLNKSLNEEKTKLVEEMASLRKELDELKGQSNQWQEEKKELICSAQLCLQQREQELEQQKENQLQSQELLYKKEIESLREAMKETEQRCQIIVNEWKSASEQVKCCASWNCFQMKRSLF